MTMKKKVENILADFLERNRNYAIEVYINNAVTSNRMGQVFITADRTVKTDDEKFRIKWNIGHDINFNEFSFAYDEADEYNQQTVYVIFKNGMEFIFECIGMRI